MVKLHVRMAMVMAVAGVVMLGGCAETGKKPAEMGKGAEIGMGPVMGLEPVSGGIYAGLGSYGPLKGEALKRGLTERGAILGMIHVEAATRPSATQGAATEAADPPPMALKYYLQGREKFLDGENTEAMELLDKALALDPNAFTVLRLMGRVCFASSELARGALYLQKAQAIEPTDVEVNYLLGRYWLEKKDFDRAIYYLMAADDSPERTVSSVETPSVSFYLARAFSGDGFHKAAVEEYEKFLDTIDLPVAGYRYDRDLNYLIDEKWATELSIAENLVLIGDYGDAVGHYELAAADEPKDAFVASRLINALVHAGKGDEARAAALEWAASVKGSDESIKLLIWVYKAEGKEGELLADLRTAMGKSAAADAAMTVAVTQEMLGEKEAAFGTLAGYLEKEPGDADMLKKLLDRVETGEEFAEALKVAGDAMAVSGKDKQYQILEMFEAVAESGAAKAYFENGTGAPEKGSGPMMYLRAVALQAHDYPAERVEAAFKGAVDAGPAFFPAREAYVEFLLKEEKFKQASEIIQAAIDKDQGGERAWQLLVESEAAQHRHSNALKIAEEAAAKYPDSADMGLEVANVYTLRGQDAEAQKILGDVIEKHPKFEKGYVALINSLASDMRDPGQSGGQAMRRIVAVLAKMAKELPASRFGQITTATVYARSGRMDEAETMLASLLPEDPNDAEVLVPLAEIRQVEGHGAEAADLLEESLKRKPQVAVAEELAHLYREEGKGEDALALVGRMAKENPEVEGFVYLQATELFEQEKKPEAIALMKAAVKKFPRSQEGALALASMESRMGNFADAEGTLEDFMKRAGETAERWYELSHVYAEAGEMKKAEETLQRVLAMMPDHTGANNDLGYFWTDEGVHLAEAERMIRKAVENEPENAAYLDSLGWLLYKEGRPGAAVEYLSKAVALPAGEQPDVMQHLGDALYRSGRKPEAMERWLQAETMMSTDNGGGGVVTEEKKKLRAYLEKVIAEGKEGGEVEVTPMVKGGAGESAGIAK